MAYVDPETVVAPRNTITSVEVLYSGGPGQWSVAKLEYNGEERLGIRWNGSDEKKGIGNPQSRGKPTWFVVPKEVASVILERIEELGSSKHAELLAAYRAMAGDADREAEAREWYEGLSGDANDSEG